MRKYNNLYAYILVDVILMSNIYFLIKNQTDKEALKSCNLNSFEKYTVLMILITLKWTQVTSNLWRLNIIYYKMFSLLILSFIESFEKSLFNTTYPRKDYFRAQTIFMLP